MTKHERVIWRLREQPSSESLRQLVKDNILTKDEAREILFSIETEDNRDKKSLESEVKFLRELVEKLSNSKNQITTIIKEVEKPYYKWDWYRPYVVWCQNSDMVSTGTLTTDSSNAITYTTDNFSNIKTF